MTPTLTILHIAFAAAWFGHKLLIPGDIRASLSTRLDDPAPLLGRLKRAEHLGQVTGVGTLLFGAALWWVVGIDTVSIGVWVGAGLVIAAILVGATVGRTATNRLRAAVRAGDRVAAAVAGSQLSRALSVEGILWLGALTAMVV